MPRSERSRAAVMALATAPATSLLSVLLAGLLAKPAPADDTQCVRTLPPGTYDNVVVPPGARCFLANAQVKGNVKALGNSRLFGYSNTVLGNVIGDKAEVVVFNSSTVRENIDIKEGEVNDRGRGVDIFRTTVQEGNIKIEKMTGDIAVEASRVLKGDIQVFDNIIIGRFLGLENLLSNVGQNFQVFKNTGPGDKMVVGNTVGENLQCFENTPPFLGGPSEAQKAEGQCTAGL